MTFHLFSFLKQRCSRKCVVGSLITFITMHPTLHCGRKSLVFTNFASVPFLLECFVRSCARFVLSDIHKMLVISRRFQASLIIDNSICTGRSVVLGKDMHIPNSEWLSVYMVHSNFFFNISPRAWLTAYPTLNSPTSAKRSEAWTDIEKRLLLYKAKRIVLAEPLFPSRTSTKIPI